MNSTQDVILRLVDHAKNGKHTKFEQLRYWKSYVACRISRRALKLVVAQLEDAADKMLKKYCMDVRSGQADVTTLLTFKVLRQSLEFYEEELHIVNDIAADYRNYLNFSNSFRAIILGEERDFD